MTSRTPEELHRRETRRVIILPLVGGLLLIALLIGLAIAALNPGQFTALSDMMLISSVLVPYFLLCLIPALASLAAALWFWAMHNRIARPLRRMRVQVTGTLARVSAIVPQAGKPLVELQSRLAYLEHVLPGHQVIDTSEEEVEP
ncbi:MAG: hypothetical protein Kow0077_10600 [Anaerolineae bacterium]